MAELVWAPSALSDINDIASYIAKDSVQAAETIVQLFFDKTEVLARYPKYGKPVPELNNPSFREILISRYRIIYEIAQPAAIHIITVHHQSRLLKSNRHIRQKLK